MKLAMLFLILNLCALANAATRDELQIQPTGPLQLSPWRAPEVSSPAYNHYIYSVPPPCDYCGFGGFSCGFGGFGGFGYGFASSIGNSALLRNVPIIHDYPR